MGTTSGAFIEHFRESLSIKTDWPKNALEGDPEAEAPLLRFQAFLAETYPLFHKAAEVRALSPYSLVCRWPGQDSRGPGPLILAHYDVVPAEKEKWTTDPFGAEIKDGYIYGRGTLDMKSILIGILEAAEQLCARGFRPKKDIWFAFGGDEERTGPLGAKRAAKWFAEKGIRFSWILDEGTCVSEDQIPGLKTPLALVGIEEKGYLSLILTVEQKPGHASRPPKVQAAEILAKALLGISKKPFPWQLTPTVESFFSKLSRLPEKPRGLPAHPRLLGPLFFKALAKNPEIAALLHTTGAITQLEGSSADNVMPSAVRAVVNFRLLPPWTVDRAIDRIKKVINDERVSLSIYGIATEPVRANPEHAKLSGPGWKELSESIKAVYPGVPVLPFLMTACTDSRNFSGLCEGIFRFNPFRLNPREQALIHAHDERISIENLERGLVFYSNLLEKL